MTIKQKKQQKRAAAKKSAGASRQRQRALPSPHAYSFTILDAQAMGAPGKTKLYDLDKKLKAEGGKGLLFKDAAGRTQVYGDMLRELCGIKTAVPA